MEGISENLQFANPWFFLLLLLLPLAGLWYVRNRRSRYAALQMPSLASISGASSLRARLHGLLPLLRALAFVALVVALARPQYILKEEDITADGVDIMLVMDLSSSMLAQDFKPDRLEASKQVADEFIAKRQYDRIGLVVFSGEAFTQCPLTTDHAVLRMFLDKLQCGLLEDGTAIGMGLATAVNRIKDSPAKSKIVILLTDGVNNSGYVKPMTASEIAHEFGVKVYTIGVGTTGDAIAPVGRRSDGQYVFGLTPVEIDEGLLANISDMTGGKYFRATSRAALEKIYDYIDSMEKTKIEITTIKRKTEGFYNFVLVGMLLLVLELLLRYTVLRVVP